MRQTYLWITLCLGVGTAACGGSSKPATDPSSGSSASTSSASSEPPPKWDDSSESADNARHPQFSSSAPPTAAPEGSRPAAAPAAPAAGPSQRRTDSYDKEATEVVLRRAARQVKDNCGSAKDENGKASGPWGKTTVTVNLGHNGHSKGAVIGAPFEGKPTGRCAMQAFANLTYPPWAGGDATVTWEVDIAAPKDAK